MIINNNFSFICLYRPKLFISLHICVFFHNNVSTSDYTAINDRIIREQRIGANVATRQTSVLPAQKVCIEMLIRIPAVLNLNFRGVTQYLHANDKTVLKFTAHTLLSTHFPSRYSPIILSFGCTYML